MKEINKENLWQDHLRESRRFSNSMLENRDWTTRGERRARNRGSKKSKTWIPPSSRSESIGSPYHRRAWDEHDRERHRESSYNRNRNFHRELDTTLCIRPAPPSPDDIPSPRASRFEIGDIKSRQKNHCKDDSCTNCSKCDPFCRCACPPKHYNRGRSRGTREPCKAWKTADSFKPWKTHNPYKQSQGGRPGRHSRARTSSGDSKLRGILMDQLLMCNKRVLKAGLVECDTFKSVSYPNDTCGNPGNRRKSTAYMPRERPHEKPKNKCGPCRWDPGRKRYEFENRASNAPYSSHSEDRFAEFIRESPSFENDSGKFVSHFCPWEADITVNGTVRGHCTSTADAVADRLTGRFKSSGKRYCTDPDHVDAAINNTQRMSLGRLDDGGKLDFTRNNRPYTKSDHDKKINGECENMYPYTKRYELKDTRSGHLEHGRNKDFIMTKEKEPSTDDSESFSSDEESDPYVKPNSHYSLSEATKHLKVDHDCSDFYCRNMSKKSTQNLGKQSNHATKNVSRSFSGQRQRRRRTGNDGSQISTVVKNTSRSYSGIIGKEERLTSPVPKDTHRSWSRNRGRRCSRDRVKSPTTKDISKNRQLRWDNYLNSKYTNNGCAQKLNTIRLSVSPSSNTLKTYHVPYTSDSSEDDSSVEIPERFQRETKYRFKHSKNRSKTPVW